MISRGLFSRVEVCLLIFNDSDFNVFYLKLMSQHFASLDDHTLDGMIDLIGIGLAPEDEDGGRVFVQVASRPSA